MLVLQRHEYYGVKKPMTIGGETFDTISNLTRLSRVAATIDPDGHAAVTWNLQGD